MERNETVNGHDWDWAEVTTAYDYDAQRWIEGPEATDLARRQHDEHAQLYRTDEGYRAMSGPDGRCCADCDPLPETIPTADVAAVLETIAEGVAMVTGSGGWTCTEADAIDRLYRAAGLSSLAVDLMAVHAESDEPGDAHYQGQTEHAER